MRQEFSRLPETLLAGFRHHALLYALLAAMYLSAAGAGLVTGTALSRIDIGTPTQMVILIEIVILLSAFMISASCLLRSGGSGSLTIEAARRVGAHILAGDGFSKLFHGSVFVALFFAAFLFMKGLLPEIVPFHWDGTFAQIDEALHFGRQPYEWLLPILGSAWMTGLISLIYNLWLVALLVFLFVQILEWKNDRLRLQSLLAFGLTWFVGTNLLGTIFSSAGPCYYGAVVDGADPFQALMAFLNAANEKFPILSLNVQAKLWQGYVSHGGDGIEGISAMPSMHVASTVLFILLAAEYRRWLAWSAAAFAAAIFLGSIILGWHYAVDGYVGAALALASWRVSGILVRTDIVRQARPGSAANAVPVAP